ncbi:MAG: lipoate--protein ligase [Firmicutes bacterium]|nr:lipoate--protein ligase [Bacillota bacterium]
MKLIDLTALDQHNGPFFFAVEEYLIKEMDDEEDCFFTWTLDPCVVIGRNQLLQNEVNETFLAENKFPIWRRPSGGGAVYADRNCVMFSFITTNFNNKMVFDTYLNKVASVFKELGINATFTGRNDLLVDDLKFSGNSFYRYKNQVVLHGTILYDVNIENLVKAITPSDEKLISKGIASVRQRVTNLKDRLKGDKRGMIDYLSKHLTNKTLHFNERQIERIKELAKKYASHDWIYSKNPPYAIVKKRKFPAGTFELRIDVKNQIITGLDWSGDFFTLRPLDDLTDYIVDQVYEKDKVEKALHGIPVNEFIFGLTNQELVDLMFEKEGT